ncbi:hypothetical protein MKX08_009595 [Trichoderma sp. CBMAI-0020]|nr:hypothetical protein MKX08_009595 [Trichoderma sp. CBMAI-0020]
MYLKAIKALRSNLKDRLESLMKYKKLKRNLGTFRRIDINAINYRRFNGTCNACGKKGHKEADCRSKMTCGFCGKKGHNETHCYTKKNVKPKTPKDKA